MEIESHRKKNVKAIVATDFDGTLYRSDRNVSGESIRTLEMLEKRNILRVIVTGRSLNSLEKAIGENFPVDYFIVSSGAGVYKNGSRALLYKSGLSSGVSIEIAGILMEMECDFMVHLPLPDNHFFYYSRTGRKNDDYMSRFEYHREFGKPFISADDLSDGCSQFLVIDPPGGRRYYELRETFPELTIIRTTSPIDLKSSWIEIFPGETDKGKTLERLVDFYGLGPDNVLAVGNDFNDVHMLEWAVHSRVVANAHPDLKRKFTPVRSNDEDGFSEAVEQWLGEDE